SLAVFPHNHPPLPPVPLTVIEPPQKRALFTALAGHFSIHNLNTVNTNANVASLMPANMKPAAARAEADTVWKALPSTYCRAFNFTTPRHRNAVTPERYRCALKDAAPVPGFQRDDDTVSWGKVFAFLMRQPLLAEQAGMIYRTRLQIDANQFPNGGWLSIDLAAHSDYRDQLDSEHRFIRRYAARIPALQPGTPRQVFAPLQFPVLFKPTAGDPDPAPVGNYDDLFIEASEYDDGYAKIVHCQQPPNRDLLVEENDGSHPVKDVGVRLGWDDEQILIWYVRQLLDDPNGELSNRLDAPLGVFGYRVDVRETAEPDNPWESLNAVESRQPLTLSSSAAPGNPLQLGTFSGELPYQVYPSQLDGDASKPFWLPLYFANWNGHSMVLPDSDAALIYQTTNVDVQADAVDPVNDTGTGVSAAARNQLNQIYQSAPINSVLRYGSNYEFRVRLQDLSGGGPDLTSGPINETGSDITTCRFRRFVSPNQPRIHEMLASDSSTIVNTDTPPAIAALNIQRPKLTYPAVVYTGKYSEPIQRLIDQAAAGIAPFDPNDPDQNAEHRVGLGIADPDVDRIEITVEIASL
ncbi:MAG: hypothetical protein JJ992_20460, partial [Planctomycetes bacterium]|nr:hypothetical protein [Planctomycetota bacterium]